MAATNQHDRDLADKLSPEAQLLLASAGGASQDGRIRSLLESGIKWPRLVALSLQEGAQPVLGRRLREIGSDLMPEEIAADLRQIERVGEFRQRYLERRVREAVEALSEAGIEVILLKGAALAYSTYGSFSERPMSDVDLLVHPADAQRARDLLLSSAWAHRFDDDVDDLYEGMHHLPPLVDTRTPALQVGLDLHTELFAEHRSPYRFDAADLWLEARPVPGLPARAFVSSLENHLLHAALHHAWSHRLTGAAWRTFRDITAIVHQQAFSWDRFLEKVRQAGAADPTYWSLRLARALAGAPVPDWIIEALEPGRDRALRPVLARHFCHESVEAEQICPSARLRRRLWMRAMGPDLAVRRAASPDRRAWHRLQRSEKPKEKTVGAPSRPALRLSSWIRFVRQMAV